MAACPAGSVISQIVAEQTLDIRVLKDVAEGNF
jgi:hypothetical protein